MEDLKARLIANRPVTIENIIPLVGTADFADREDQSWSSDSHDLAENLELWCREGEIQDFLGDQRRVDFLLASTATCLYEIVRSWINDPSAPPSLVCGCDDGCIIGDASLMDDGPSFLNGGCMLALFA